MSASELELLFSFIHPEYGHRHYSLKVEPTLRAPDVAHKICEATKIGNPVTLVLYYGAGIKFNPGLAFHAELVAKRESGQLRPLAGTGTMHEYFPEKPAENELHFYALKLPEPPATRLTLASIPEETPLALGIYTSSNDSKVSLAQKAAGTPSTEATLENMLKNQRADYPVVLYNGRPISLSGPHIGIYNKVFAEFENSFHSASTRTVSHSRDLIPARQLIMTSERYYDSEKARKQAIKPFIEYFLGRDTLTTAEFISGNIIFKPGGCRRTNCGLFEEYEAGYDVMVTIVSELKNGANTGGCDPLDQASKDYTLFCLDPVLDRLRKASCMPAFLLCISGSNITVAGAIYAEDFIIQKLATLSLTPPKSCQPGINDDDPTPIDALAIRTTHFFRSLEAGVKSLEAYYKAMSQSLLNPKFWPHLVSIPPSITLTYKGSLFPPSSTRTVFLADARIDGKNIECIVKFAYRYGQTAHRVMEEHGAAPKLLYCNWERTVGLYCVITEFIETREDIRPSQQGLQTLRNALGKLHDKGLVHGDLREPNIIVDQNGHPYVCDFDWSGEEGKVRYPGDINTDIEWVEGVKGNAKISRKHDDGMLEKYIEFISADRSL